VPPSKLAGCGRGRLLRPVVAAHGASLRLGRLPEHAAVLYRRMCEVRLWREYDHRGARKWVHPRPAAGKPFCCRRTAGLWPSGGRAL